MKKVNLLIFVLVIIVSILALTIFLNNPPLPDDPVDQSLQLLPDKPEKQAIVHYPVPVPAITQTQPAKILPEDEKEIPAVVPALPEKLPPVQQSDESFQLALENLQINTSLIRLVLTENLIQRLVVTIDNLTEKNLPRAHLPLLPPKGRFLVSGTEEAPQTSSRNQNRYTAYVQLLEALEQDLTFKIYIYFYPLFQTAYEQLGYRNAYFNDRLINVIDHLLETPNPAEPLLLAQPSVLYIYADPLLEKLSSGQKILLRIGPDLRLKVLQTLQRYREKLVALQP